MLEGFFIFFSLYAVVFLTLLMIPVYNQVPNLVPEDNKQKQKFLIVGWIICISLGKFAHQITVSSDQISCVWLTLCNPMDCSTPGYPVHHELTELAQTHVHRVGDAIQTSHPPLSPSPLAFNLSQHQSLLQWLQFLASGGQSNGSFSFSISPTNEYSGQFPLGLTGLISLQSKGLSRVFSKTTVQKHQFFGAQISLWSNSHIHTWPLEKP